MSWVGTFPFGKNFPHGCVFGMILRKLERKINKIFHWSKEGQKSLCSEKK